MHHNRVRASAAFLGNIHFTTLVLYSKVSFDSQMAINSHVIDFLKDMAKCQTIRVVSLIYRFWVKVAFLEAAYSGQ